VELASREFENIINKFLFVFVFLEFDNHFIDYLSRPEIDGWEVRKGLGFFDKV